VASLCQTCRTAETGPLDCACGSEAFPFLDRSTGEVGVRGAPGPSPPCTSEVVHPPEGKRDDGGLAAGGGRQCGGGGGARGGGRAAGGEGGKQRTTGEGGGSGIRAGRDFNYGYTQN
jgi:hypothetical protein